MFFGPYKFFSFSPYKNFHQFLVPNFFFPPLMVPVLKSNQVNTSYFLMNFYRDVYNIIKISTKKKLNFF